jgi:hypothetical protein
MTLRRNDHSKVLRVLLAIVVATVLEASWLRTSAAAQYAGNPAQGIPLVVVKPTLRTPADMAAYAAAHPVAPGSLLVPFRPTMDINDYVAAKAAAATAPFQSKPTETSAAPPAAPPTQGTASCNRIGQPAPIVQGFFPPDTHGAVGANHFVQVVNSAIRVYSKALVGNCPDPILLGSTLNGFFGYAAASLFDPRVIYDMSFDRWIVSAEGFPEGGAGSNQFHFVAVSQTGDAAGAYFIYQFNMRFFVSATSFWDFPQLGYDEESIIVTGSYFDPGYVNSLVMFLPKARMYRGLGFSFCGFLLGANGTVAPPLVLDQSPVTVLATSRVAANRIRLTKYTGTSRVCPTFVETVDLIPTKPLSIPPNAPQPGTVHVLDTSDARFVNASTQFGEPAFGQTIRLWQTATLGTGFATPRFYQINANVGGSAIENECSYFASGTSSDFNASVAANLNGDVFITYSSTDVAAGVNPQVRFTGKKFADACSTLGAPGGVANVTSTNPLTGNFAPSFGSQRWGDYSAVTIDPSDITSAWAVNERAMTSPDPTMWKSRIFNMNNP